VYPSERDPTELFRALRIITERDPRIRDTLRIRFRAPVAVEFLRKLAHEYAVDDMVEIMPTIAYRQALQEMMSSEALLILQAANCNEQIPAKLYEYLRAGRPIIGLTDLVGDTAVALRRAGLETIAPLDDANRIADMLLRVVSEIQANTASLPRRDAVIAADRRSRTKELSDVLNDLAR
jgi:hypothetical protein